MSRPSDEEQGRGESGVFSPFRVLIVWDEEVFEESQGTAQPVGAVAALQHYERPENGAYHVSVGDIR